MGSISWQERYKHKLVSPEEALKRIRRGGHVFIGSGCAVPQLLAHHLGKLGKRMADVEIIHTLTLGVAPYVEPKFAEIFRPSTFFVSPNMRQAVLQGRVDYIPVFLSEVPALFKSGRIPIDVALIQVSSPDEHGFCSYGISVDIVKSAAENAKVVVAELNPHMPRTLGDSFIHVDRIDALVENDAPLVELNPPIPNEIAVRIAKHVASLIDDGSTIQIGIGSVLDAIPPSLTDKRDLGIHTEFFSDAIIPLIESGVVTNRKKTIHQGKIVASFCMGTQRLYDLVDNNPLFEFHPSEYANDPFIISQNDNMVAVNAALEVDLTGQVCADSLGYLFYSGMGGHVDFIRGAARSKGGKPIIALPSTNRAGTKSRIVPHLAEGAGVVTTRGDVHYVVTEYGIAYLYGKNVRERAVALINIAHPKFREELLESAKRVHYVYPDQSLLPEGTRYPEELETCETFKEDLSILFKPIELTDERLLQDFFYSLSDKSVYTRFLGYKKAFPHKEAQPWVAIDYLEQMAIVGITKGEEKSERIVAVGQYFVNRATNMAEIALAVADQYQNMGVGSFLLNYLVRIAKERGISGFTGEMLASNFHMLHIFHKCGYPIESNFFEDGVYLVKLKF